MLQVRYLNPSMPLLMGLPALLIPYVSTMVIDSPDAYVRSITHERVDVEYREVSMDIIYGDPTYYRYLIGEWPAADDIALATYIERKGAVYDALPAALELAQEATAALQAAEQAERARQREAEQALQAALEELAGGFRCLHDLQGGHSKSRASERIPSQRLATMTLHDQGVQRKG